jgi:hypothetical protein
MSDSSTSNAVGGISLFISICGMIYTAINHKKIRGKCCGHELSASIDIEPTTPSSADKAEVKATVAETKERRSSVSSVKSDDSIVTIPRHPAKKYHLGEMY